MFEATLIEKIPELPHFIAAARGTAPLSTLIWVYTNTVMPSLPFSPPTDLKVSDVIRTTQKMEILKQNPQPSVSPEAYLKSQLLQLHGMIVKDICGNTERVRLPFYLSIANRLNEAIQQEEKTDASNTRWQTTFNDIRATVSRINLNESAGLTFFDRRNHEITKALCETITKIASSLNGPAAVQANVETATRATP